jgi:hypothetical protein
MINWIKVICIKDCYTFNPKYANPYDDEPNPCFKDKFYYMAGNHIYLLDKQTYLGSILPMNEDRFINIAEWREKQIDSILNDDN